MVTAAIKRATKWIWLGLGALVLAYILYRVWTWAQEGFQNITGKAKSFVVFGALSTITSLANLNKIGSIEKGSYNESYAIATITDYKGAEVWKAGQTPSTDDTKKQYRLKFPNDITISYVDSSNVPAKTVDVFVPKLAAAIPTTDLSYVGEDFTSPFIIVEAKITLLIDPYIRGSAANQYKGILSSLGTGKASTDYAVTTISDEAGTVYYDKTKPIRNIYTLNFTANMDLDKISNALAIPSGADRSTLSETDIKSLRLIGAASTDTRTTFTGVLSRTVAVEGPLAAVLSEENLDAMKAFSTSATGDRPASVVDVDGKTLWSKTDAAKRYKVEFAQPVNLRLANTLIAQKISGAKYVGLVFNDTPPATANRSLAARAQLGAADYSSAVNTLASSLPESQFPATFLDSGSDAASRAATSAPAPTSAAPTYQDPRATATSQLAGGTDFSGYVSTMTPLSNRFRIRGQWSTISKPGMIATLGIAAGKLPDGTYPKVMEILNYKDQKIWPEGSPGAVPYVDTGISELFTVGYDVMVDPQTSLQTYIPKFMPSITLVNPAMPRPAAK